MKPKILLKVTGSIAAYKAAALCSKLVQNNFEVKVVLTRGALDFVGKGTFEGMTGHPVSVDLYADGTRMDHIHLARWADLQLVYPASAETLSKLRGGRAEDLLGALFLAHPLKEKPYWVAPAMNPEMFAHPAVSENMLVIQSWGVKILMPGDGRTACGEVGAGRLQEPEDAFGQIVEYFKTNELNVKSRGKKILITAGGTYESLDPVRGLTNVSTGETGMRLAEGLTKAGAQVTLLLARSSVEPKFSVHSLKRFSSFEDLEALLEKELSENVYDTCIHSAAVSDFKVDRIQTASGKKISTTKGEKISSQEGLTITLSPRHKLVSRIKSVSKNKNIQLISFKLSAKEGKPIEEVKSYVDSDFVVHNFSWEVERGSERHHARFFQRQKKSWTLVNEVASKADLVRTMIGTVLGVKTLDAKRGTL
jgi:phosphopantothenoylcysteine decarboxylase / phosphopantothenate---cysteine ligase